jgi:hypothetical protein
MTRLFLPAITLLVCLLSWPVPARAQDPSQSSSIQIEFEFSPVNPPRSTAFWMAIGEAANRAADLALDRAFTDTRGGGAGKIAWRLGRLWLVSMPIASFAHGGSHDGGHFARDDEIVSGGHSRTVLRWPWPVPLLVTEEHSAGYDEVHWSEAPASAYLGPIGGGEQGALALRRRLTDAAYTRGDLGYFDATLLVYATLDFPLYAWTDLRGTPFTSFSRFYEGTPGDFRQYAEAEACVGLASGQAPSLAGMNRFGAEIRRSAWLNLADTTLWFSVHRAARYLATGEASGGMPTIRLGNLHLSAGAYATLGSTGLERGIDVRFQQTPRVIRLNVRSVAVPNGRLRWGGGINVLPRAREGIRPLAQLDVWQGLDRGTGARFEAGLRRAFHVGGQPLDTGFRVGYKSEGYLPDAPTRHGVLGSVFTTVRF